MLTSVLIRCLNSCEYNYSIQLSDEIKNDLDIYMVY